MNDAPSAENASSQVTSEQPAVCEQSTASERLAASDAIQLPTVPPPPRQPRSSQQDSRDPNDTQNDSRDASQAKQRNAEEQNLPLVFTPVFKPVETSDANHGVTIPQTASYSSRSQKKAAAKKKAAVMRDAGMGASSAKLNGIASANANNAENAANSGVANAGLTNADIAGIAGITDITGTPDATSAAQSSSDFTAGLARLDSLALRPRASSRVLCVIFGLLAVASAFGAWRLGVCTMDGQSYDDIVFTSFNDVLPAAFAPIVNIFTHSWLVQAISVILGIIAAIVVAVRRRWWLLGQLVAYALVNVLIALLLKDALPRPFLINTESSTMNSAPSGHTIMAAAAGIALLCAVPRAWRALTAVVAWAYAILVGMSVIAGGWHRPTDVVMSLLLCGGVALLVLAASRTSGMDQIGDRASSPSIQIVGSVMLTAGVLGLLYAGYILWQIQPGLQLGAEWTQRGAVVSAMAAVAALASLMCGLVLSMRQLTASPLTKLGLVGAPPAPPKR